MIQKLVRCLAVLGISAGALAVSVNGAGAAKIPHGGTVTFTRGSLAPSFDPATTQVSLFTGTETMEAVYGPGLIYVDPTTGETKNGQAEALTSSPNGKVWTMVLHKRMKFSDGTPFNAAAVCADIARLADPATGSLLQATAQSVTCKALNATTVRWTLKRPNYLFRDVVSQDFPFIPSPTAVAAEGSSFAIKPVGAGPFQLQTLVTGVTATLVANPYYKLFAPGQPYLSSIVIESSGTLSQIVAALQSGQAQITSPINSSYATEERAAGMQAAMHTTAGGAFLAINTQVAPFNNVLARQAIADVINRAGVAGIWAPGNPVTTNLFPPTSPFFDKKLDWPGTDPAKAQAIFNQLAAQGTPVKFAILWETTVAPAAASYIQSLFAGMQNVTVSINLVPPTQYNQAVQDGNYQIAPEGLYNTTLIPAFQQWFETGGSLNVMGWNDPTANAAMDRLYTDKTVASQKKDWGVIIHELTTQVPVIWTQQGRIGIAYNPSLIGGVHAVEFGNSTLWGGVYRKS